MPLLDGLRVLEAGHGMPGPMAGMVLGDLGAQVIKIEGPNGDPLARWAAYETWNRNKRIVRLDLTRPEGIEALEGLLEGADAFIDSTRLLKRYRSFAALSVASRFPNLVYCSLSAYPPELDMDHLPARDALMSARAGIFTSPYENDAPERELTQLPIASTYAALTAAHGVMAGLLMRERGGEGQWFRVSMMSALFQAMGLRLLRTNWSGGAAPRPATPRLTGQYECADGRWIQAVPQSTHVPHFLEVMGLAPQFDAASLRVPTRYGAAHATLTAIFRTRPAAEWEQILSLEGLCGVVCLEPDEWLRHPAAREAGLVVSVPTQRGDMIQPGPLLEDDSRAPHGAFFDDMETVEWSGTPATPRGSRPGPRRPLEGMRVVDLSIILAGPTCGRLLGDLGADVVKVDGPGTLPSDAIWLDGNRGKRSIAIDLKRERGREALWRLIEQADVVVENFTLGTAERLGLGYEAVRERNPRAVYAQINSFGHHGPRAGWHGWEHSAQAITGMEMHEAGPDGRPHMVSLPLSDYGSAYAAAIGVLAALRRREGTGEGALVRTSLAAAAGLVQSMHLFDYVDSPREQMRRPRTNAVSKFINCDDGLVYVQCAPDIWSRYISVAGHDADGAIVHETCHAVLDRLGRAGVAATRAPVLAELYDDQDLRAAGLVRTTQDEAYGIIDHIGSPYHASWDAAPITAAPVPGEHSRQVLKELGYSRSTIARLIKQGAVIEDLNA